MLPSLSLGGRKPASISANCLAMDGNTKFGGCPSPLWLKGLAVIMPPVACSEDCGASNSAIALLAAYGLSGRSGFSSLSIPEPGAYTCDVLTFNILGGAGKL